MSLTGQMKSYINDEGVEVEKEYIDRLNQSITIPYNLKMCLNNKEFTNKNDVETQNKRPRIVTEGNYLQAWNPDIVVGGNLVNEIQINYSFQTMAG
jgi:hypothetical protein